MSSTDTTHRRPSRWKIIIAPDGPWRGEMYPSRAGTDRRGFTSVVDLCSALLATTGWALPPPQRTDRSATAPSARPTVGRPATKIIVVADEPWRGAVYATTTTGSGRLEFDGVEQFVRAVEGIAGWAMAS